VEYRPVKLGPSIDGLRIARDGIQASDWVVVEGLMSIRPGAKVQPKKVALSESKGATNAPTANSTN
jgi:multidrug efflux system membrane fusion protein